MRQTQHKHRSRSRNRRQPNPANRVYESSGPGVKVRGTAQHVADKYMQLGRDALASGDAVKAEGFFQHAEHYLRIIAAAQEQMQARRQQAEQRDQRNRGNGRDKGAEQPAPSQAEQPVAATEAETAEQPAPQEQRAVPDVPKEQPAVEADPSWGGPQPSFLASPAPVAGEKEEQAEEKPRRARRVRRPRKTAAEKADDAQPAGEAPDEASA